MAEQIKAAINRLSIGAGKICVINALGYKSKISNKTVDDAIDGIISIVHSEIDSSHLSDNDKEREKALYTPYAKNLGELLKNCLHATQQLV